MKNFSQRVFHKLLLCVMILIGFTSCDVLFKKYFFSAHHMPSEGMEPTLQVGDYVFAKRFDISPKRGDIILYKTISEYDGSEKEFAKRLIGIPGDRILYRDRMSSDKTHWVLQLFVNGKELPLKIFEKTLKQENYDLLIDGLQTYHEELDGVRYKVFSGNAPVLAGNHFPENKEFLLGPDEFFVIGDNRFNSYDSRWTGPLKKEDITGTIAFKYFSINWKDHTCEEILEKDRAHPFGKECPRDFFTRFDRSKIRWANIGQTGNE